MDKILILDIVASVFGLTTVVLAGRNSKYNFYFGYLYTAALFVMFLSKNLYASLLLQPISLGINVFGHYRWTHPKENERSAADSSALKVSMLSWAQRGIVVLSVFAVAGLWGWLLDSAFPADPHPYLDSCLTVLILMAQLLSALKKWDCWIAWIIVNLFQIYFHIMIGNIFMPIVCTLYLINGIWSLVTWVKLYKKNS